jgi:predicted phage baseplate assembly protein
MASQAQVEVTFTSNDIIVIEKGTKVVAEGIQTGEKVTFETDEDIEVLPAVLKAVVSFASYKFVEVTEFNAPNQSFYYPFGEKAEIGSRVYLGFDFEKDAIARKRINLNMNLYEEDLPPRGQHDDEPPKVYPSAQVSWEYWNGGEWSALELNLPVDELVETLSQNGSLSFIVPADMARSKVPSVDEELYWVRCRVIQDGYEIPPRIDRILLNTVSATQRISVHEEILKPGTGLPYQTFTTSRSPVLVGSEVITIKGESWQAVDDFDASNPESKHYVISGDKGEMAFGNGVQGRIPPKGEEIEITYRYGGGEVGNVPAKSITKAYGENGEQCEVTNHFPAAGGREKETIQEAILRARRILKTQYRAVTSDDFESIAKATPGLRVARAKAIVPTQNSVTLVVVPHSPLEKATPSNGFIRTVCEHVDKHRLITTFIKIEKPDYVRASVNTTLKIKPGYKPESVRGWAEQALSKFLSPVTGGPDNQGWPFGRSVYRSEVHEVLEGVEGVDCVLKLFIAGADQDLDIGDLSLVYPGTHTVEIIEPETVCKEMQ